MKRQNSSQSQIFIITPTHRQTIPQQQQDNPQNNFQKLMSLQPDNPIKQCKNLLLAMTQHHTFQKNIIKSHQNFIIPSHAKSQQQKICIFNHYQIIKKFTNFHKKKQHFEHRKFASFAHNLPAVQKKQKQQEKPPSNRKKPDKKPDKKTDKKKTKQIIQNILSHSKPHSLRQIIQNKKNQMLNQNNLLKINQNFVQNIMIDNQKRQKIFQQALLLQRLYDIEINKLKNVGVTDFTSQVPQKFRGIQPKHIRIASQQCKNQQDYFRKKYVCKKRKLQFYVHAKKIQQNSLKHKKQQNLSVLQTLMKFNQLKCATQGSKIYVQNKNEININQQDLKIKKLFLKYSSSQVDNHQQIYKYIQYQHLLIFFKDFQLHHLLDTSYNLQKFIQQKKQINHLLQHNQYLQRYRKIKFFLFDFIQILYILAAENDFGSSATSLALFLQSKIWIKKDKVIPQLWLELQNVKNNSRIQKFLKIIKFQQKIQQLFKNKSKINKQTQISSQLINFDDVLQITWQVKLFPLKVSKKQLRFNYLYCRSNEYGLTHQDFSDLILIIGLKFGPEQNSQQKIKWVANQIIKNVKF